MYISRLLPLVAFASASFFNPSGRASSQQLRLQDGDEPNSVPGDNPLSFCDEPSEYLLEIENVDLDPNPPSAGKTLSIKAIGELKTTVEKGAYVAIQVKYGLITLIKQKVDLCDQVKEVDKECPLEPGELDVTKDVDLPNEIPPGMYTVLADVFTKDDVRITCLTAKIRFSRGG